SSSVSSGAASTLTVTDARSPRRASDTSGTTSDAGANPSHSSDPPPSAANANPPNATRPDPAGPSEPSVSAEEHSARQRLDTASKRSSPFASSRRAAPSPASA